MSNSPIVALAIVVATMVFQVMLFGGEIAERSFPTIETPENSTEDCDGIFGGFTCGVRNAVGWVVNFFKVIGGGIAFFFHLITFNIPGAPWFVRLIVGSILGGALLWSILGMFRGN